MFTHLHAHTEYSLLDGANKVKNYIAEVKRLGMTSAAITDHGVMYGCIAFYKEAKKQGINPIIGCEVYVSPGSRFDKSNDSIKNKNATERETDKRYHHLVLLVENETGYKNLCKLCSAGFTEGFYFKPRVDKELLQQYSEGLICLSACLAGVIPYNLLQGNYDKAKEEAIFLRDTFGKDNFFIELQDHGIEEQREVNPQLIRMSQEIGVGLVATNDIHYTKKEDAEAQDILMCIQTGKMVKDPNRMKMEQEEFYVKSEEEMKALFPAFPEAISNTQKIADRCNFEFEFGITRLPYYEIPEGFENHFEYFKHLCDVGMKNRYGVVPAEYQARLDYELGIIEKMGYIDYFLIVWDFINYAREQEIPVGPGRGSGAGSIAAYAVGITDIDPMHYNLFFERFLNPERVSMPDFDIDFCYERRHEVIDYVVRRYGKEKVSQIITYQTMAAKGSVRDVGKVLDYPYAEVDKIAKMIPDDAKTLKEAFEKSKDLQDEYAKNPMCKHIMGVAVKIEGMPKSTSKHAAGVLICDKDIVEYAPLKIDKEGEYVIQCTMTELEDLGLLKMDFLGLRTLTVIKDAEKAIRKVVKEFDISKIPMDDKETFKMLSQGDTFGVFQLESLGMKGMLAGLQPESIEDITAGVSLYRPGPMDSIPEFIKNKNNPESIVYDDPRLESILGVTYGCLVYQEQVMRMFQELAGFSLGRADIVRRAMSKKKADVMAREQEIFIYGLKDDDGNVLVEGAKARGVDEAVAKKIMDEMTSFAAYAFNKSHAACYAVVAYQTAYLKKHYPVEFVTALLTSVIESNIKLPAYTNAIQKEMGIKMLPPDVNKSQVKFSNEDGKIRFALSALKGVGENIMLQIVDERAKNGDFDSFYSFCKRTAGTKINKKGMESLIMSGAFNYTGYNRKELMDAYPTILQQANSEAKVAATGQMNLFQFLEPELAKQYTEPDIKHVEDYEMEYILKSEKNITNLFLSGHPLQKYTRAISMVDSDVISDILLSLEENDKRYESGSYVTIPVILSNTNIRYTKSGSKMATFKIQDESLELDSIAFKNCVEASEFLIVDDNCVLVRGKIEKRDEGTLQLICNSISPMPQDGAAEEMFVSFNKVAATTKKKEARKVEVQNQNKTMHSANDTKDIVRGLHVRVTSKNETKQIFDIVSKYPGMQPVYVLCTDENKIFHNTTYKIDPNNFQAMQEIIAIAGNGNTHIQ